VTYTIYVLRCADGSLYTGIARDLEARIAAHNRGAGARYTRGRGPVEVVWKRGRQAPRAARQLEYAIKALPRRDKERLIAGDEALWRRLRRAVCTPGPSSAPSAAELGQAGRARVTSSGPRT
jgi:predicted GIY-YIG superfamily endonuclease